MQDSYLAGNPISLKNLSGLGKMTRQRGSLIPTSHHQHDETSLSADLLMSL